MEQSVKRVGKNSLTYSIAALLSRGIAFILFPIYATYLTPAEYGILAITNMVSSILVMLLPFGLLNVVHRFHFTFDTDQERKTFYGAIWSFLIASSACIVVLLWFFSQPLFEFLFRQTPFSPYIQVAFLLAFLNTAFLTLPIRLFQIEEKALAAASLNLLQFSVTAAFAIYYLIVPQLGVDGAIYAQLIGVLVASIVALVVLIRQTKFNFQWGGLSEALRYSIPLMPHFVSNWILNISDRAILERYLPLSDVGIYSVGYQLGNLFQMVVTGSNNALIPMHSRAIKDDVERGQIPRMATYFLSGLAYIGFGLMLLAPEAIDLLASNAYEGAAAITPWIVVAYMAMAFYYVGMDSLIILSGVTKPVPFISFAAAIINIAINLYFIPQYGIVVAAISTTVSYIFQAFVIFIVAQSYQTIHYEWGRIAKVLGIAAILYIVGVAIVLPISNLYLSILIKGLVSLVFPVMLYIVGFFEREELSIASRFLEARGLIQLSKLLQPDQR